ncbi:DUF1492 domain-containing protein [Tissierella praeacuta]|uniref:DUF1492 domain-containing protein n=1 Tax=Tissierella praeacuta TaxID=43131 RepID=UPI00334059B6
MNDKQLRKANFKLIELELYCYHENKRELELLRESIVEDTVYQEVSVQSGSTSDITANKAIKLVSSKEILELERRIRGIEEALNIIKLDEEKYRLLKMKYFERKYTDRWIWRELNISDRTFYRWRREIIEVAGSRLGWRV